MNCHMPKINEGMQDVVRTHAIFSPTNAAMIEANEPNACNLRHLEENIDWTLAKLKDWYGREYDDAKTAKNYPDRKLPVGQGWLKQDFPATRLVAVDALGRSQVDWAAEAILPMLDDPYLLNRQFIRLKLFNELLQAGINGL